MIKINVLRPLGMQKAHDAMLATVAAYHAEREVKSFSQRNLDLGKMINCPVCVTRHREARTCIPTYAKKPDEVMVGKDGVLFLRPYKMADADGVMVPRLMLAAQHTAKGVMGAARFRGRVNKHRNAWGLQVLERATRIFTEDRAFLGEMTEEEEAKLGKQSLSRALNEKRKERASRRRNLFVITRESRRINRSA